MLEKIKAFLIEEDGSESAEYGVITGVVVAGVVTLAKAIYSDSTSDPGLLDSAIKAVEDVNFP